jgi:hypothetical protein
MGNEDQPTHDPSPEIERVLQVVAGALAYQECKLRLIEATLVEAKAVRQADWDVAYAQIVQERASVLRGRIARMLLDVFAGRMPKEGELMSLEKLWRQSQTDESSDS